MGLHSRQAYALCAVIVGSLLFYCQSGAPELFPRIDTIAGTLIRTPQAGSPGTLSGSAPLRVGDVLEVAAQSKATLRIQQGSTIYLLGDAKCRLERFEQEGEKGYRVELSLARGECFVMNENKGVRVRVSIVTPTALIALSRGAVGVNHVAKSHVSELFVLADSSIVQHRNSASSLSLGAKRWLSLAPTGQLDESQPLPPAYLDHLREWLGGQLVDAFTAAEQTIPEPAHDEPPRWLNTPAIRAYDAIAFLDTLRAEDPEQSRVRYQLRQGPRGMTVDSLSGIISFMPRGKGKFPIALIARDRAGNETPLEYTLQVLTGLQAVLSAPDEVQVGQRFGVDGSRSMARAGSLEGLRYRFDVNGDGSWDTPADGSFGDSAQINHYFDTSGDFVMRLEVQNPQGKVAQTTHRIRSVAINEPPRARLRIEPSIGVKNNPLMLDAQLSSDSHDPLEALSFRWDLEGDGVWDIPANEGYSKQSTYRHSWSAAGTYRVCMEVVDTRGASSKSCALVEVVDGLHIRSLRGPDTLNMDENATFECIAIAGADSIVEYGWDFNNDTVFEQTSSKCTQLTRYERPGKRRVRCRVKDASGAVVVGVKNIYVRGPEIKLDAGGPYAIAVKRPLSFGKEGGGTDERMVLFSWDFNGDGTIDFKSSTLREAQFIYYEPGEYRAIFSVQLDDGTTLRDTAKVTVVDKPPQAYAGDDVAARPGKELLLRGVGDYEGAAITKYSWDLDGDGSEDWASPTTGHYMKAFNQYTEAIFCVYGDDGAFACDTVAIVICPDDMALVKEGPFCVDRFEFPNRKGEAVRTGVTLQQAAQLCAESGKRLCSAKQWRMACSADPKDDYPYGRRFVQDNCNTLGNAISRNEVVGAGYFESCVSPLEIHDMSGNVAEWVRAEGGEAFVYGGSYQQGPQQASCNASIALDATKSYFYVGFRCCK